MRSIWKWYRDSDSILALFVRVLTLILACMMIPILILYFTEPSLKDALCDTQTENNELNMEIKELKSEVNELKIEMGSLEAKLNSIDIPDDTDGVDEDGID